MMLPLISFFTLACGLVRAEETKVISLLTEPYLMHSTLGEYEGMIVDILDKIFHGKDGSNYKLTHLKNSVYGSRDSSGNWNGLIGEIVNHQADLAAAPLTISEERKEAVAFTQPFMKFDFAVLMTKVAQHNKSINSLDDLAKQKDIKYGVVKDGSTQAFFKNSKHEPYKKMYSVMNENPNDLFPDTYEIGIKKIRQSGGKFAMIIESPAATYWANKSPCDLVVVEGKGESRQYAFAVRKDDEELRKKVDEGLKELGEMQNIKDKWWKHKTDCNSALGIISVNFGFFIFAFFITLLF